jgi:hypothetical protein
MASECSKLSRGRFDPLAADAHDRRCTYRRSTAARAFIRGLYRRSPLKGPRLVSRCASCPHWISDDSPELAASVSLVNDKLADGRSRSVPSVDIVCIAHCWQRSGSGVFASCAARTSAGRDPLAGTPWGHYRDRRDAIGPRRRNYIYGARRGVQAAPASRRYAQRTGMNSNLIMAGRSPSAEFVISDDPRHRMTCWNTSR